MTEKEVSPEGQTAAAELRKQRGYLGLSDSELARRSGVSVSTLSRTMRGTRTFKLDEFFAVCRALELLPYEVVEEAVNGEETKIRRLAEQLEREDGIERVEAFRRAKEIRRNSEKRQHADHSQ